MSWEETVDVKLEEKKLDGFLMIDDSSNASMYYSTGFKASDTFTFLHTDGKSVLMVPDLEKSRAEKEADVDKVESTSRYRKGDTRGDEESQVRVLEKFLKEHGVEKLGVPKDFELGKAEKLREKGFEIETTEDFIQECRIQKTEEEVEKLREVQQITEEAMQKVENMIEESEVQDEELYLNGEKLTSERIKKEIKVFLLEKECETPEDMIVASGAESADPHSTGSGPIKEGETIVVDIFPRHSSLYFGDMTRTFVKGESSGEVRKMYEAVQEALEKALKFLESGAGVSAEELNDKVCDVLEEHGYQTPRQGEIESGFLHSTGHGVGLDLHEPPRLGPGGGELEPGTVVTVEPGLYIPEIGGVRLEDMVLITEDGYENFNSMNKELEV